MMGKFDDAFRDLNKAIELRPGYADAHLDRAKATRA